MIDLVTPYHEDHVRDNYLNAGCHRCAPFFAGIGKPGNDSWEQHRANLGFGPKPPIAQWQRGDWMQTFTGRRFYPLDPRPEEIDPEDIAHALSLLCRYGGHVDRFYSVAEHCVLMSQAVAPEHALAALLHDATEAYVCDIPRPLKRQLSGYRDIEAGVWNAICMRYHLAGDLPAEVKEADNRILITERLTLMSRAERWGVDEEYSPLSVEVLGWAPPQAEEWYLRRLAELEAQR